MKIGLVAPMTGQLASEGQDMENAVKLAIADADAKGGVLGGKITTVTAADAFDPQQGAAGRQQARLPRASRRSSAAIVRVQSCPP